MGRPDRIQLLHRLNKTNKRCCYCGCKIFITKNRHPDVIKGNEATVEHIYPKIDIRRFLNKDWIIACKKCNQAKAYKDYDSIFNNETYMERNYKDGTYKDLIVNLLKNKTHE